MLNWDDMRVFIAVVQAGSFVGAGRRIGMDPTTVARRIQRLEASLKATLVVRRPQGLQLTAAGARLAEAGASVEAAIEAAGGESKADPLAGTVRISAAEGFASEILAPALPEFLRRRPGLRIEIDASPGYLSAATRKVDIAITSSRLDGARLTVEPLTDYELGLYASRDYLASRAAPETRADLAGHEFVGCVDDLIYTEQLRFLDAFEPDLPRRLQCSSMKVQILLAMYGGGIAAFPHFLVENNAKLVRILPEMSAVRSYWMATHHEFCDIARVRLVRTWLQALARENAMRLTPEKLRKANVLQGH